MRLRIRSLQDTRAAGGTPWLRRAPAMLCGLMAAWTMLSPACAEPTQRQTAPPAPHTTRPLLWTLAGDPPSFLFGTIHVADPRVLDLPEVVLEAFAACDEVRTEIPLDATSMAAVAEGLMLPRDQTLSDVLPAELVQRLEGFLTDRGFALAPFARMKPWVVASMLTLLDARELMFREPLDQVLYTRAQATDKTVGGLETAQEQLDILDSLDRDEEADMLAQTLDMLEKEDDYLERLIRTYLSGDADALLQMVTEFGDEADPAVRAYGQRLVEDRNHIMATRIVATLRATPGRSYFFAVGAGHLAGDSGLVQLLRANGFEVERVAP